MRAASTGFWNFLMTAKARLPFFYGWIVVAVTFITMAIGVKPLSTNHRASRPATSQEPTIVPGDRSELKPNAKFLSRQQSELLTAHWKPIGSPSAKTEFLRRCNRWRENRDLAMALPEISTASTSQFHFGVVIVSLLVASRLVEQPVKFELAASLNANFRSYWRGGD
jgi:hypothetical protein